MTVLSIFSLFFIKNDISSARQRIHMKHQGLVSSKDKSKKIKESSVAILLGSLRVNF